MNSNRAKVNIQIFVESRYRVNRKRIKSLVEGLINKNGTAAEMEISIAVVGDRKMKQLSKKYKGDDKTRNILSFSQTEGEKIVVASDILRLGDIVLSYPQIIREASAEEKLVDDKIDELIEHGLMHLLGIHHE